MLANWRRYHKQLREQMADALVKSYLDTRQNCSYEISHEAAAAATSSKTMPPWSEDRRRRWCCRWVNCLVLVSHWHSSHASTPLLPSTNTPIDNYRSTDWDKTPVLVAYQNLTGRGCCLFFTLARPVSFRYINHVTTMFTYQTPTC